jgi:hypothetical protein
MDRFLVTDCTSVIREKLKTEMGLRFETDNAVGGVPLTELCRQHTFVSLNMYIFKYAL